MKIRRPMRIEGRLGWWLCYLVLCGWVVLSGNRVALAAETNQIEWVAFAGFVVPKSVFIDDPENGRDPFFPLSTRRITDPDLDVPILTGVDALELKGITGPAENRIALINNLTFTTGEVGEVRGVGQTNKFKIQCLDIREKSVVVRVIGQAEEHELFLPDNSLKMTE